MVVYSDSPQEEFICGKDHYVTGKGNRMALQKPEQGKQGYRQINCLTIETKDTHKEKRNEKLRIL
jgi:hypothetical protein